MYQYRKYQYWADLGWLEGIHGPAVDRSKHRVFLCAGTTDLENQMAVVTLKGGPFRMDARLTVEFHHLVLSNETGLMEW